MRPRRCRRPRSSGGSPTSSGSTSSSVGHRSGRADHRGRRARHGRPGRRAERREPLRGVRRQIAEHLTRSHREVPAVTVVEECDFTALSQARGERSYLPYVLAAVVAGLKAYPELNATLAGNEIVYWERYDLGLAVQTDEGLVVPVLRAADEKSLDELGAEAAAWPRAPVRGRCLRRSSRLHVHGHERGPARRALRDAARQPSRSRDPRPPPDRPPRRRRGRRGGAPARSAGSPARSTTAWSTARERASSSSRSSSASSRPESVPAETA